MNKNDSGSKRFWWPELSQETQTKCDEWIQWKVSGKSNKLQKPKTEKINFHRYKNQTKKSNCISSDQTNTSSECFLLLSVDRYSTLSRQDKP